MSDDSDRIFILGPSHHYYLDGCALSRCHQYATPLGNLRIDREVVEQLQQSKHFEWMEQTVDEAEHSIEMHLPYIYKAMETRAGAYTIVPILVGNLSVAAEALYGRLLATYLANPRHLFVISSDFCHWGSRFSYHHHDKSYPAICDWIEALDREGMRLIEAIDAAGFANYLKRTRNTICGRHPIAVLLHAILCLREFERYAQSNRVTKPSESSVSYASAVFTVRGADA